MEFSLGKRSMRNPVRAEVINNFCYLLLYYEEGEELRQYRGYISPTVASITEGVKTSFSLPAFFVDSSYTQSLFNLLEDFFMADSDMEIRVKVMILPVGSVYNPNRTFSIN